MQQTQGNPKGGWRRGGGSSVTLLFVAAASLAAAVFALTQAFLSPADGVAAFVPGNAVVYVHAGGRAAANAVLSSSVQMPSGIAPDEVAVFATPGDDALRWGVLFGWRTPKKPSESERGVLADRGAVPLDARRYLIGDASLAVASRVAAAAHASLADDGKKARALALVRSIAAVQIYADPSALLPSETAAMLAGVSAETIAPSVAAVNLSAGTVRVRALPLETAASASGFLGYREKSARGSRADLGRFPAPFAIAEDGPSFDVAKLLTEIPRADAHPAPAILGEAGDALRDSLALPYELWLRPDVANARVGYLLRFPGTDAALVKKSLARFAAAIDPERSVLRLPDGAAVTEFRLDAAAREAGMTAQDDTIAFRTEPGNAVIVGDDGNGGTLVGSAAEFLAEYRGTKPSDVLSGDGCPATRARSRIEIDDAAGLLAPVPQAEGAIKTLGLKRVVIGSSGGGDKELLICGYKYAPVDK